MAGDSSINIEEEFSGYVDSLMSGEDVSVGPEASDEIKEAVAFARRLALLSSDPLPSFKADLETRLLAKLAEKERRASWLRNWWESGAGVRWVSLAATAAVVLIGVVVFLNYRAQFSAPTPTAPTSPAPTTPAAPTSPSVPASPAPSPSPAPSIPPPAAAPSGPSPASYAYSFDTLSDLTAFSDSIVVAKVDRAIETTQQGAGLYTTRWALRVEGLLKGPQLSQLTISQTGSPDVPGSALAGDPLFRSGERYLLFLKEGVQFAYFGPYGRYLISEDGKVYSMNHVVDDGGYRAPVELDFAGKDLDSVVGGVAQLANSVQLIFTQGDARLPADVLRSPAGTTLTVDVRLSAGENGPAGVAMKIDRAGIPTGLDASIEPSVFVAHPGSVNTSKLTISVASDLPAGTYRVPVEYVFGGAAPDRRVITLHVEPR